MKLELAPVLNLLHSAQASTLATHSLQMPGYPYATVVPNILDEQHRSVLLISAPVSYTHLDVYKRQAQRRPWGEGLPSFVMSKGNR